MPSKKTLDLLRAAAFAVSLLWAVHLGVFVWLSAFRYRSSIRGYVPAGLTALGCFAVASFILLLYLSFIANRRNSALYSLIGLLAPGATLVGVSIYSSALLALVGYSFKNDLIVSSVGCVLGILGAVYFRIGPSAPSNS